jgi:CRISPR/Cas system-associated protein Csm6
MAGQDPTEIQTEPATLDQLDVVVEELAKAEKEERAAREDLRQAEIAWRAKKKKSAELRDKRNQVMGRLRHEGVTPLAERVGVTHQQASRILAEGQ